MNNQNPYNTGHPWYYVLGGKVLSIRNIWEEVNLDNRKGGYNRDEIKKAFGNNEKLRALKAETITRLKSDISRYRQCVLKLHKYRKSCPENHYPVCEDVHVSVSLKVSHIYNELANLKYIEELLSYQPDLFDIGHLGHE